MTQSLTPAIPELPVYRLTVEQYEAMLAAGILNADDRVELLSGWLVPKMTKNSPHIVAGMLVSQLFTRLLPPDWCLAPQAPVIAGIDSLPEPDFAILRGAPRDYKKRRPNPGDVGLVIEIADSSVEKDTETKWEIYGRAGICLYWVLIVREGEERLQVFTEPFSDPTAEAAGFRRQETFLAGQTVPLVLDGTLVGEIAVDDLLP